MALAKSITDEVLGWRNQGYHPFPPDWEYLLLSESVHAANSGIASEALAPLMRKTRDEVIAGAKGELFA